MEKSIYEKYSSGKSPSKYNPQYDDDSVKKIIKNTKDEKELENELNERINYIKALRLVSDYENNMLEAQNEDLENQIRRNHLKEGNNNFEFDFTGEAFNLIPGKSNRRNNSEYDELDNKIKNAQNELMLQEKKRDEIALEVTNLGNKYGVSYLPGDTLNIIDGLSKQGKLNDPASTTFVQNVLASYYNTQSGQGNQMGNTFNNLNKKPLAKTTEFNQTQSQEGINTNTFNQDFRQAEFNNNSNNQVPDQFPGINPNTQISSGEGGTTKFKSEQTKITYQNQGGINENKPLPEVNELIKQTQTENLPGKTSSEGINKQTVQTKTVTQKTIVLPNGETKTIIEQQQVTSTNNGTTADFKNNIEQINKKVDDLLNQNQQSNPNSSPTINIAIGNQQTQPQGVQNPIAQIQNQVQNKTDSKNKGKTDVKTNKVVSDEDILFKGVYNVIRKKVNEEDEEIFLRYNKKEVMACEIRPFLDTNKKMVHDKDNNILFVGPDNTIMTKKELSFIPLDGEDFLVNDKNKLLYGYKGVLLLDENLIPLASDAEPVDEKMKFVKGTIADFKKEDKLEIEKKKAIIKKKGKKKGKKGKGKAKK